MGAVVQQSMQRMPGLVGKLDEHATSSSNLENVMGDDLRSPSTSGSTPDQDQDHDVDLHDHDVEDADAKTANPAEQPPQPQKRKGGRKPVSRRRCFICALNSTI